MAFLLRELIFDDLLGGFVMIYLDWFVLFRLHESLSFLGSLLGSPDFFGGSLSLLRSLLVSQECFFWRRLCILGV